MAGRAVIQVHPTAVISEEAVLSPGVEVGPHVVITGQVSIGEGTRIGPGCLIQGPTEIGAGNQITGHASLGTDPQDLKYGGEESWLRVGDENRIREFVTLNRGTGEGGGETVVGDRNLLMTGVHIAHDCYVGSDVILANAATLAGHVDVSDHATVGAFTGIHQFCRIGREAFIGGYSVLTRDALPFVKTVGVRGDGGIYGINTIGLERKGYGADRIQALKEAYRHLFKKGLRLAEALEKLRNSPSADVRYLVQFIEQSERGFVR